MGPSASSARPANAVIDAPSARSSAQGHGLAAGGADLGGQLLAALDAAGAEHHRVPGGGEARPRWPRRCRTTRR